jgi:sugar O-acyltransferase (sialic acid O-acetyltransferase NeuD family)
MSPDLFLFPCNGNSLEAMECLEVEQKISGFIDDSVDLQRSGFCGLKVFSREIVNQNSSSKFLVVPGNPVSYLGRSNIIDSLKVDRSRFATLIHPSAVVSRSAKIGFNSVIMAGAVVGPQVVVGNHVIVMPNAVIHHDTQIGDLTIIGSNVTVAGHVTIGRNCYIGSGASLIHRISIGDSALVGMGSTVIRTIGPGVRVAGNPARDLSKNG